MNSRSVKRIADVARLRAAQFPEDSGAILRYPNKLNFMLSEAC